MERETQKYLSLEFIIGNDTYWIMSYREDDVEKFGMFYIIPKSDLPEFELIPSRFDHIQETYTEIYQNSDSRWTIGSADKPETCMDFGGLDMAKYTVNSDIKSISDLCIKNKDWDNLTLFFHQNLVKPKSNCFWKIDDVVYKVTAFLPDQKIVAVMAENYSTDNKNWLTINFDTESDISNFFENFDLFAVKLMGKYRVL